VVEYNAAVNRQSNSGLK